MSAVKVHADLQSTLPPSKVISLRDDYEIALKCNNGKHVSSSGKIGVIGASKIHCERYNEWWQQSNKWTFLQHVYSQIRMCQVSLFIVALSYPQNKTAQSLFLFTIPISAQSDCPVHFSCRCIMAVLPNQWKLITNVYIHTILNIRKPITLWCSRICNMSQFSFFINIHTQSAFKFFLLVLWITNFIFNFCTNL